MTAEAILESLEKIIADLSIELRYEKGQFKGGYYRYKDTRQIVVNKNLSTEQKITILATEIKTNTDLDKLYLTPVVREVVENASRLG